MEKRYILWWLLCFLLVSNTLVTLSVNIAIVAMVNFNEETENSSDQSNIVCQNTTFFLTDFFNKEKISAPSKDDGFDWTKEEQGRILSGYYWLNYISILPGGILAQKYGSKIVVGYAQVISSVMASLIPVFASYGANGIAWIRAIQGLLSFVSVPAGVSTIYGRWCPPQERGTFGAGLIIGSSFGQALCSYCFGYIAENIHWGYVFHLTSVCGIIWGILWYLLIHDFPQDHPTITLEEKVYIEKCLNISSPHVAKEPIPWKSILTSVPLIINIFAVNATVWTFVMMVTYIPLYLTSTYGLNSEEIGIILSVPQLCSCAVALVIGYLTDLLIKKNILSISATRKICTWIGSIFASIPLIVIAFDKCNINLTLICLLLYALLRNFSFFGSSLSISDVSPKFCGILSGISGTSSSIQTFLYSAMISYFSGVLSTENLWKLVFIFTASLLALSNTLYIFFGSSKVQSWNDNLSSEKK